MKPGLILMMCGILIAYLIGANVPEPAQSDLMLSSDSPPNDYQSRFIPLNSASARDAELDKNTDLKFGNYPCTPDCSEHEAGYRWGKVQGISDPDNCSGNTGQFIEGCRVYAEEREAAYTVKSI